MAEVIMCRNVPIQSDHSVAEVLTHWPQTAQVFIAQRMACVGCPMASFETLAQVAQAYELEEAHLLHLLERSIDAAGPAESGALDRSMHHGAV